MGAPFEHDAVQLRCDLEATAPIRDPSQLDDDPFGCEDDDDWRDYLGHIQG